MKSSSIMVECNIEGVVIRRLDINSDQRGWLIELFRGDDISTDLFPVMAYVSMTRPGVARGPHEHREQTDYICIFGPSKFIIKMWDNRQESSTFGNSYQAEADFNNPVSITIPAGVVHAYKNVGDVDGLVFNAPNRLYTGHGKVESVDEIRYEKNENSGFIIDF
jgi:dTDP-4-dehydrorhamnose 3,5-epimerase